MKCVRLEDLAYGDDGLYYHHGAPFTGAVIYGEEGGWIQAEEEYREGLLWGRKREWYRPGALEREAQCAWGVRHGLCREWDEGGRLTAEANYEHGVRVSGKRWDSDGKLIEDFHIQEGDPGYRILEAERAAAEKTE
jgi:antitoxin component YwqK of YwqJK toxin-antitoxin module